jgi:four helix bundle protein
MNEGIKQKIVVFTDLYAWQEGHKLALQIYEITKKFPKEEIFGLTNQMRRCAVSITSNIAEGFSRQSYKEKSQFYSIAQGSVTELQSQLFITRDIKYITEKEYNDIATQITQTHKLISGLIKKSKALILNS